MFLKLNNNPKLESLSPIKVLEYIESTGTQYIDTEFKPNQDTRVICCFNDASDNNEFIFGARHTGNANQFGYLDGTTASQGIRYGSQSVLLEAEHNAVQTVDANKNVWSLNGNTATASYIRFTCNYNMYIFTCNNAGSTTTLKTNLKIYYFKIYDNDVLVRDLVPALDPNNIVCMYDKISEKYFYNKGSGNFLIGDINGNMGTATMLDRIAVNINKLFIKDCNYLNGYKILKTILNVQSSDNFILSRVRLNIGNVSGNIEDLTKLSILSGFNDNGEEQIKPRIIGNYTLNDWYTKDQVNNLKTKFDGLTIIEDTNYLIDLDNLAVQTLDNTKPNYNPAVAIILQANNKGITLNNPVVSGGGRWFLTKAQASNITSITNIFKSKSTVIDTNGIVTTNVEQTYNFETFDEFKYLTSITRLNDFDFDGCTTLTFINLSNVTYIGNYVFRSVPLNKVVFSTNLTSIGNYTFNTASANPDPIDIDLPNLISLGVNCFNNCKFIKNVINLGNITHIPGNCFAECSNLQSINIPASVTTIGNWAFRNCSNLAIVHFDSACVIQIIPERCFEGCIKLTSINISDISQHITTIKVRAFNSVGPTDNTNLINVAFPNLTTIEANCFEANRIFNITSLGLITIIASAAFTNYNKQSLLEIPSTVIEIKLLAFNNTSIILHLLPETPPTLNNQYNQLKLCTLYVGDGSSASHDDTILQAYLADSTWSSYSNRLDTWYNYLHPTT